MPPNILIRVGAETAQAAAELKNLNGPLSDVQTKGEKMGAGIRKATLPAIAVLGGLAIAAKGAATAAAEDEAAQEKMAGALERVAGATAAQVAQAETYISKLSLQTGIADDELRPALTKLASATGDVGTAQDQLSLALDISAQSGKSLDVVTKSLAAANDGHTASLSKLVPGLDQAILKSKDMDAITDQLSQRVGGAAVQAAGTATGKYRVMQVQMGELQETLGAALIPAISLLSSVLLRATSIASEHTTAVKVVIGVVAALAAGVLVANAAMKLYTAGQIAGRAAVAAFSAAQWLMNAALTANPIGLVVVALAGLAAGLVIAYKRSETFRDIVNGAFSVLKTAVVLYLTPARLAIEGISSAIQTLIGWIANIHWPSPPSWLGKVGGVLGHFGAVAPGNAPAAIARAGSSSAAPRSSSPRAAGSMLSSISGGGVTVNFFAPVTDPEGTARALRRQLRGHVRRQGALLDLSGLGGAAT